MRSNPILGRLGATDADGSNEVFLYEERHTAFQRKHARYSKDDGVALLKAVCMKPRWPTEIRRVRGFGNRHVNARVRRLIHPLKIEEPAAVIHKRNRH
jgi:hypothetical protein